MGPHESTPAARYNTIPADPGWVGEGEGHGEGRAEAGQVQTTYAAYYATRVASSAVPSIFFFSKETVHVLFPPCQRACGITREDQFRVGRPIPG